MRAEASAEEPLSFPGAMVPPPLLLLLLLGSHCFLRRGHRHSTGITTIASGSELFLVMVAVLTTVTLCCFPHPVLASCS